MWLSCSRHTRRMAWVVLEGGVSEPNRYHLKRSLKPNKEKLIQNYNLYSVRCHGEPTDDGKGH